MLPVYFPYWIMNCIIPTSCSEGRFRFNTWNELVFKYVRFLFNTFPEIYGCTPPHGHFRAFSDSIPLCADRGIHALRLFPQDRTLQPYRL